MPLDCVRCGWSGEEDDAEVETQQPSPDGHYARVYRCPKCKQIKPLQYAAAG